MYTILIGIFAPIVIFILVGLIIYLTNKNVLLSVIFDVDNFLAIGGLTIITFVISFIIAASLPLDYYNQKTTYNLESLEDGRHGAFFLGCGIINDEMTYSFYYENKGYYQLEQLYPYNTKIKYTTGKAKFIIYRSFECDNLYNKFATHFFDYHTERYVLSVPKGTIKNNYYLDTK